MAGKAPINSRRNAAANVIFLYRSNECPICVHDIAVDQSLSSGLRSAEIRVAGMQADGNTIFRGPLKSERGTTTTERGALWQQFLLPNWQHSSGPLCDFSGLSDDRKLDYTLIWVHNNLGRQRKTLSLTVMDKQAWSIKSKLFLNWYCLSDIPKTVLSQVCYSWG